MSTESPQEQAAEPVVPVRLRAARLGPLLVVGGLLAAVVAAALLTVTGAGGIADTYGLTVVRVAAEIGCALTVGSLLFATFLTPPQQSWILDVGGYAALRTANTAAALWLFAALLAVPFTVADAIGKPVTEVFGTKTMFDLIGVLPQAKAWLWTALVALLITVGTRLALSWGSAASLFLLSLVGIVPIAASGHSSAGGAHDLAVNSLLYHLIAAALWVGGLVALLAHGRRQAEHLGLAARRFSMVAMVCWPVMALSGVINALIRMPIGALLTTPYGLLVAAKTAALLVLGVFGYVQRERGVRAVLATGSGRALLRLAAVEVLVMFGTFGIASALARTPPPAAGVEPSAVELQLGYPLAGPPTVGRLLFDWRFDLIYGTIAIVLAVAYLLGVRRLAARGDRWPIGRTLAWLGGCLTILIATSSGFGKYAPAMFSIHMETHMMLAMLAPVLLVLGGPVTLALRALRPAGKDGPAGPREWLLAAVHSPVARTLTNPIVALVLFVGSFYVLYLSGLFDAALEQHWAHLAMNAHFLLVGCMFYWPVIGIDPAPNRLPHLARLGMVFASLPFHAFFGVTLMSMQTVIGEQFYRGLDLPWITNLLTEQRLGGGIAWASGELPLLLVLIALLVQWGRADDREARRSDRRADAEADAELEAYNAMLRKLAKPES